MTAHIYASLFKFSFSPNFFFDGNFKWHKESNCVSLTVCDPEMQWHSGGNLLTR